MNGDREDKAIAIVAFILLMGCAFLVEWDWVADTPPFWETIEAPKPVQLPSFTKDN